jgi:hypothetical protein
MTSYTLKDLAKNNNTWIAGDFNLPDIEWKGMSVLGSMYPNHLNTFFIDIIQELALEQIVDFPTLQENILNLVLTTHPSLVNKCQPLPGLGDHDIVLIDANIEATRSKTPKCKIFIWKLANLEDLREVCIKINDFMTTKFSTIDDMWINFKNTLLNAMEKSVPSKLSRSKPTYPWITTEVRRSINRKNKAGNKSTENQQSKRP